MPEEQRRTLNLLGKEFEVTEVPIASRTEQFAEYKLADGATIRFTVVPTAVLRIEGQWNPDGNPVYVVQNGTIVTVIDAPEKLKKK